MRSPLRRLRRWRAELALARVDADVAYWLVEDGALARRYMSPSTLELRARRLEAVGRLVRAGGSDPFPQLMVRREEPR